MGLSQNQLKNVCQLYGGYDQCRYLQPDNNKYGTFTCLKQTCEKDKIDNRVKKHLEQMKASGQDPKLHGVPCGDGGTCKGYLCLKHITQGYDIKN